MEVADDPLQPSSATPSTLATGSGSLVGKPVLAPFLTAVAVIVGFSEVFSPALIAGQVSWLVAAGVEEVDAGSRGEDRLAKDRLLLPGSPLCSIVPGWTCPHPS